MPLDLACLYYDILQKTLVCEIYCGLLVDSGEFIAGFQMSNLTLRLWRKNKDLPYSKTLLLYGCGQHQREKCAYIKDNCTLFSMMSTATVLNHVLSPLAPR